MATTPFSSDILQAHNEKMEFFAHRRDYELPAMRAQIDLFEKVLRDEAVLTDAMANAVFKDHILLKNCRVKEKARLKSEKGKNVDESDLVDEETLASIRRAAKEHTSKLRRLKGKSASKFTPDEIGKIQEYIKEKRRWVADVESDAEFIEYVFRAQPVLDAYVEEMRRTQEYLEDENAEFYKTAVESATKRLRNGEAKAPMLESSDAKALVPHERVDAPKTLDGCIVRSDAFSELRNIQSAYYMAIGEPDPTGSWHERLRNKNYSHCDECHVEMIINAKEAQQSCPECGLVKEWRDASLLVVPFGDPISAPRDRGKYQKSTYYDTWKKMVSGELNREIPDEDWQSIYQECVNRRLQSVDRDIVRKLLNSLDMTHHYKHRYMIANELNDVPLIKFSPEEERTLDCMFDEAVKLFAACPFEIKQRDNFISYPYFFHQACRMAGYTEYLPAFSLLTGRENRKQHDRIWQWMCENKERLLGGAPWKFHPTA